MKLKLMVRGTVYALTLIALQACNSSSKRGTPSTRTTPSTEMDATTTPVASDDGGLDGGAAADVSVASLPSWSGAAGDPEAGTIRISFTIADDGGTLSGVNTLYDPSTHAAIVAGSLAGQRTGNTATWTTTGGLSVTGTFNGNTFTGTATFTGAFDAGDLAVPISLKLGGGR
jgi:hypothetical protein